MAKPVLLVTRRLPPSIEARAVRDYEVRLNPADTPRTGYQSRQPQAFPG